MRKDALRPGAHGFDQLTHAVGQDIGFQFLAMLRFHAARSFG